MASVYGIGLQSAGTTSAGFGSPATASEQEGVILRDESTGASFGGRKIDPVSGDYELDSYGRLLGMNNVRQMVMLAVLNSKNELGTIERLNDGFERAATAILTEALQPIVAQGLIEVLGVSEVRLGVRGGLKQGQALYRFRWRDLTTKIEHAEPI
jgi:hypothetical protein